MNTKEAKALRGQIRQIVKEELPGILASELIKNLELGLKDILTKRLDAIDERQKDISHYVVNQSAGLKQK